MAFRTTAAKLMLNKIGIVGGRNIGGVLAQECAKRNLAKTVALMDIAVSLLRPARDNSLPPRRGSPPPLFFLLKKTPRHRSQTWQRGTCLTLRKATLLPSAMLSWLAAKATMFSKAQT